MVSRSTDAASFDTARPPGGPPSARWPPVLPVTALPAVTALPPVTAGLSGGHQSAGRRRSRVQRTL